MKAKSPLTLIISIVTLIGICGCKSSPTTSPNVSSQSVTENCPAMKRNGQPFDKNAIGEWVNVDENTRSTTKLLISQKEDGWFIQGWGACHPTDCDWGKVPFLLVAEGSHDNIFIRGFATWNFRFKTIYVTIEIRDNHLFIDTINVFTDNSKRSNYFSSEEFQRGVYDPKAPPDSQATSNKKIYEIYKMDEIDINHDADIFIVP
jgi:hypothetical protein